MSSKYLLLFLGFFLFSCAHKASVGAQDELSLWLRAASQGNIDYLKKHTTMVGKSNENGTTALMSAASRNQDQTVKFLLEAGEELNALDNNQDTALFYTIAPNHLDAFKELVRAGAAVKNTRIDGISPLMMTVDFNREEMLDILLTKEVEIDQVTEDGWSALFFTLRNQRLATAKKLISFGANAGIVDKDGRTVLDYAIEDKWKEGEDFFRLTIQAETNRKEPVEKIKN